MGMPEVLLCDFSNNSEITLNLISIIKSGLAGEISMRHETMDIMAENNESRIHSLISNHPEAVFLIIPPEFVKGVSSWLKNLGKNAGLPPFIVVTNFCTTDDVLAVLESGASDFIVPPLSSVNVLPRLFRLIEHAGRENSAQEKVKVSLGLKKLIGESLIFRNVINKIPLIARCDACVLIEGETGTGKELCARAIHYLSPRSQHPFVPINCGAIPIDLIENELFGHEQGAFTSAVKAQAGLIEEAQGGTLFLDEVNCLGPQAQVKLLRFIQENEYRPLGSTKLKHSDVRVISAANGEELYSSNNLRRDLYYRLNVIPLQLPSLRERKEDIPLLVSHFLCKYSNKFGIDIPCLSPGCLEVLMEYNWPGNVRELEHIIERAVVMSTGNCISIQNLEMPEQKLSAQDESFQQAKARCIARFEKEYIQKLLLTHDGNITKAAQVAKKNRRAFWQLIRKHNIDVHQFKNFKAS